LRAKPLHIDLSIQPFQHFNEHFLLLLRLLLLLAILEVIMMVGMKERGFGEKEQGAMLWTLESQPEQFYSSS
jgi:hypothetical protein